MKLKIFKGTTRLTVSLALQFTHAFWPLPLPSPPLPYILLGTEQIHECPLLDLPTGVCTFYMDTTDPKTPAVAVSCGNFVYVFKNMRPYFKFTLPLLEVHTLAVVLFLFYVMGEIESAQVGVIS